MSGRQTAGPPSAYGFHNIPPMQRNERRATKDKVALEQMRLKNRAGQAARMNTSNLPPEGHSLTELTPEAAGYIADADRFHTDTAGEEYLRRKAAHERHVAINDARRETKVRREEDRWRDVQQKQAEDERHWAQLREDGLKAKKNESGVPYNTINLNYNDGLDGDRLRYEDDATRYRAQIRSNALVKQGDTRCGYNILTGESRGAPNQPPQPHKTDQLVQWEASGRTGNRYR